MWSILRYLFFWLNMATNYINNILPIVRNVVCKTDKGEIKNILARYYLIKILLFFRMGMLIKLFDHKIVKTRVDFYFKKKHSVIFVKPICITSLIKCFSDYITEIKENQFEQDTYCCKLIDFKINNQQNLKYIKDTINMFKSVDFNYNKFCNRDKYGISLKLIDILELDGHVNIKQINYQKIIPPTRQIFDHNNLHTLDLEHIE